MMPITAASTGAALRPSASPAARPSITTSTFSSTPAPTPSIARIAVPRGVSSMLSGWTSSSFAPSNLRCFWVATTVPTTRPICITLLGGSLCAPSRSSDIPVIDDADDAGIDGRLGGIERKARFLAADEEHFFANAGAHRVDGDERPSNWLPVGRQWLHDQQRDPGEVLVLAGRDDVANHPRELH